MIKIDNNTNLFNKRIPTTFGYSLSSSIIYNIEDFKVPPFRLKEWDFYEVTNNKFVCFFIIGHVSYATSINFTLFEFDSKKTIYVGKLLPFKKVKLEKSARGDSFVFYKSKDYNISFNRTSKFTYIKLNAYDKTFKDVIVDICLENLTNDSILVSTPFKRKKEFYYNEKRCLMNASGSIKVDDKTYLIKENESFGLMDFGRGVLPFKHNWVWGNGSGIVENKYFGFNIGKFGNNEYGTENIFFYDNKSYKLNNVSIKFNENNYMDNWTIESDDKTFMFIMTPLYDNYTHTKALWVNNSCHQVFGKFNGYIKVGNNKIEIRDFFAFIENAYNRW